MKTINFSIKNQIAYLELNRPEKRNALNKEMIQEILKVLKENMSNRSFKVLVIHGSENFFCSGADLEWMQQGIHQNKTQNIHDAKLFNALYHHIYNFPTPVVCEVQNSAFGGAVGIIACSDIVICEENSRFGFPEVQLGLIPATISPYILKKMGNSNTRKRLLMPESFSAQEAQNEGLVHFISKNGNIREETIRIAKNISKGAPDALIQTKALIQKLEENNEDETTLLYCARMIASARTSKEGQEGVTAFLQKRKPEWNNEKNVPTI
ncbi:enoyl-CoA hydratase/isomerase family protein [Plebeiibacterium sediminum]|uniref:Enoyl-CoA hydratase-related protein n=1 Tax=Plebeiibacterium sediminum TaxID=2992112 RepID=A0AAE3SH16_9BACT|nr:enoyl-CoA hydratase-related protein [Plebeiobacterium sediminum]MCW3788702.1 enoyl-CoA hydratase-related protein [Plebeiobacterium sediminum]